MYTANAEGQRKPVTIASLVEMKQRGQKISCLTVYDYSFTVALDQAGVDVMLVGDSLGMVMQGRETTLPVTMEEIIYHCRCVASARPAGLLMADMPFMSHGTVADALHNAGRLMKEGGARIVKLEGTGEQAEVVTQLAGAGIPVCAHLGLRPQAVHKVGGYRVQGRDESSARAMVEDARVLEHAGADMLLLECVPVALAAEIARGTQLPVIGIGAGPDCDGQILVLQDMLGLTPGKIPRFAKNFMPEGGSIHGALQAYVKAVADGTFPASEHCF